MTDGTADYNAVNYRLSAFYDLAKTSVIRLAWGHARELAPHGATAVALTPGWLRSEMMLDIYGVTEANWRDALATQPHFAISETPLYVGRAVAALAADEDRARWNGMSLSSGGPRAGVRLHRRGRQPARRVALPRGGPGRGEARGRDGVPLGRQRSSGGGGAIPRPETSRATARSASSSSAPD